VDAEQTSPGYVVLPRAEPLALVVAGPATPDRLGIITFTVLLVWVDRFGYRDNNDPPLHHVNLLDAIYYSTVTLSTTGYGDITPVSPAARLVNAFVITPLRIAFLVLLIGTTLEVLATQGRRMFRISRWRNKMSEHVVIVGYGTKGRSAVDTLVNNGVERDKIVVVDKGGQAVSDAHEDGLAIVTGDATRREVLQRAGVGQAHQVIITTDRDDSNVLATLTVRQLNADAWIVASVREHENAPLMKQSGANSVITSSDAVGRLLGLSSLSPDARPGDGGPAHLRRGPRGRRARPARLRGRQQPQSLPDQVIAVVRDENVYRYFDPIVTQLARGDRLIVVRPARELPWAPRPAPTARTPTPTSLSRSGTATPGAGEHGRNEHRSPRRRARRRRARPACRCRAPRRWPARDPMIAGASAGRRRPPSSDRPGSRAAGRARSRSRPRRTRRVGEDPLEPGSIVGSAPTFRNAVRMRSARWAVERIAGSNAPRPVVVEHAHRTVRSQVLQVVTHGRCGSARWKRIRRPTTASKGRSSTPGQHVASTKLMRGSVLRARAASSMRGSASSPTTSRPGRRARPRCVNVSESRARSSTRIPAPIPPWDSSSRVGASRNSAWISNREISGSSDPR
jgi:voltage-gated potassium channel